MKHAAILAALAAGCTAASGPWEKGWARGPVEYVPPLPVREGRSPIDLPTVLRLAGANNLDIAYVRERVHEAHARAALAEEKWWPAAGPVASFRRHEGRTQATEGRFLDVDKQQTFAGVRGTLQWQVGEAVFANLSAAQRVRASEALLEATEQDVVLEAAQAYTDLVREHLRERVAEQSTEISRTLAAELEEAFRAGRAFEGDVLRARVQEAGGRLQLLRAQEAIRLASLRLGSLLRLAPGIELVPVEEMPALLQLVDAGASDAELLKEALERRAEVREGLAEVEAGRHDLAAATWGPLIPFVQAEAAPGALGPAPSDLEGSADYLVGFGWKIGEGGLLDRGRIGLAEARLGQAEVHLERVRRKVADQVLGSLAQMRAKQEQRVLAERAMADAERALALNRERQANRIGLPLEVLQAEESLTRARLDYFTAVVEYNQAQLRAFTYVGRRHEEKAH